MSQSTDIERWIVELREASGETGTEAIAYGQGEVVKLRGPSAGVLELQGLAGKTLQWAPIDKRALDLEVRIKLVSYNFVAPDGENPGPISPDVRAALTIGHGSAVWDSPPRDSSGLPTVLPWAVPARGAVWRTNARELGVTISIPNLFLSKARVAVSVQPCSGAGLALLPPVDYVQSPSENPLQYSVFPAEATSFRLFDPITARPYTPGERTVKFVLSGAGGLPVLGEPIDAQLYNDPHAIPIRAFGILADGEFAVEYSI